MKDVDMYGIPYQDHDPLLGLVVTIILIVIFYIGIWIIETIKKINL